ncbi:hypothetical protein D3C81_2023200 [compost metagenome]
MAICGECESIVQHLPGAAGHDNLVSLGYLRCLAAAKSRARHEAFVCGACGTAWDYVDDKRDEMAGWTRSVS